MLLLLVPIITTILQQIYGRHVECMYVFKGTVGLNSSAQLSPRHHHHTLKWSNSEIKDVCIVSTITGLKSAVMKLIGSLI